jgi:hypothetical protein
MGAPRPLSSQRVAALHLNGYRQVKSPKLIQYGDEYIQTSPVSARRPPPDIIFYAVWFYYLFNLSHRDIEDLLAERGITVSREAVRLWHPKYSLRSWRRLCIKFGAIYSRRLKRKPPFFIRRILWGQATV